MGLPVTEAAIQGTDPTIPPLIVVGQVQEPVEDLHASFVTQGTAKHLLARIKELENENAELTKIAVLEKEKRVEAEEVRSYPGTIMEGQPGYLQVRVSLRTWATVRPGWMHSDEWNALVGDFHAFLLELNNNQAEREEKIKVLQNTIVVQEQELASSKVASGVVEELKQQKAIVTALRESYNKQQTKITEQAETIHWLKKETDRLVSIRVTQETKINELKNACDHFKLECSSVQEAKLRDIQRVSEINELASKNAKLTLKLNRIQAALQDL